MNLSDMRVNLNKLQGQRSQVARQLREARVSYIHAYRESMATEEARAIVQLVAQQTQDQIRYHITELGTMALQAVFGDDIQLDLQFTEQKGKTLAILSFLHGGEQSTNPLESDSGGASDIAAFALRCSLWAMKRPRTRPTMVLDEPFKNINDPSRQMHRLAAEMVAEVSKKLGIQFLIVTMVPELEDVADLVVEVK
jgi:DNA repair exonuclease SbcCD ATPase subunit